MPQRIQRHRGATLHRSAHPQGEQDKTEKSIYGLDCHQKAYEMVPQNCIINCFKMYIYQMRWSHKLYKKKHINLESGIDIRRGKLSWRLRSKEVYFKEMHYDVTIYNCHDSIYILRKCTAVYKLCISQEKISHLMDDMKMSAKYEKERETLIHVERIYGQYIRIESEIEKCTVLQMKRGKRHVTDGMELPKKRQD